MATETVNLPCLVAGPKDDVQKFINQSGFEYGELKYISSPEKLYGYQDKILFLVGYVEHVSHYIDVARAHNIKVIRV